MLLDLLLPTAQAADHANTHAQQAPGFSSLFMLVGFVLIFYFLLWRPQAKRAKEHRNLIAGLQKGDEVVTNGGLLGKINQLSDDFLSITIAEGVDVKVQKGAISASLPKGTLKSV